MAIGTGMKLPKFYMKKKGDPAGFAPMTVADAAQ